MLLRWEYLIIAIVLLALKAETQKSTDKKQKIARIKTDNNKKISGNPTTEAPVEIEPRIVGGHETSISNFPHLVQVRSGDDICGGSLIAKDWVLTAAHCVDGVSTSIVNVRGGTSTLDEGGVERNVTLIKVAPKYTKKTMNMDAALLKLGEPLTGTNIAVIELATWVPKPRSKLQIAGWGYTKQGGDVSQQLRTAEVNTVKFRLCRRNYRGSAKITKYMFCARARGKDACSGDSGGGVVQRGKLVGIVSFGYGCAQFRYPGVYAKIKIIRNWVNKIMSSN